MSSRREDLSLYQSGVNGKERVNLCDALMQLAQCDADFSGQNGEMALWEAAKEENCESNAAYVWYQVKYIQSNEECAKKFVEMWMKHDNYYGEYKVDFVYDHKKELTHIILAFTSGC